MMKNNQNLKDLHDAICGGNQGVVERILNHENISLVYDKHGENNTTPVEQAFIYAQTIIKQTGELKKEDTNKISDCFVCIDKLHNYKFALLSDLSGNETKTKQDKDTVYLGKMNDNISFKIGSIDGSIKIQALSKIILTEGTLKEFNTHKVHIASAISTQLQIQLDKKTLDPLVMLRLFDQAGADLNIHNEIKVNKTNTVAFTRQPPNSSEHKYDEVYKKYMIVRQQEFLIPHRDNHHQNNLVNIHEVDITCVSFNGGGVKGLGHIGAMNEAIEKKLIDPEKITAYAGTSAGALMAGILALGYTTKDAAEVFQPDFEEKMLDVNLKDGKYKENIKKFFVKAKELLSQGDSKGALELLIKPFITEKVEDSASFFFMPYMFTDKNFTNGFRKLMQTTGIFNPQHMRDLFKKYIDGKIKNIPQLKNVKPQHITFTDLATNKIHFKKLVVYGTNLSTHQAEKYSFETTPNMSIIDALVISMSIPGFFKLQTKGMIEINGDGTRIRTEIKDKTGKPILCCDGGVLKNDPVDAHDNNGKYNPEALTFMLVSLAEKNHFELSKDASQAPPTNVFEVLSNTLKVLMGNARKQIHNDQRNRRRIVYIDTTGVGTVDFHKVDEHKTTMFKTGKAAVNDFIKRKEIQRDVYLSHAILRLLKSYGYIEYSTGDGHALRVVIKQNCQLTAAQIVHAYTLVSDEDEILGLRRVINTNVQDIDGLTAYDIATRFGYKNTQEALILAGFNSNKYPYGKKQENIIAKLLNKGDDSYPVLSSLSNLTEEQVREAKNSSPLSQKAQINLLEGKNNTILKQVENQKIELETKQDELKTEKNNVSDLGQNILDAQTAKEQQKKTLLEKSTQINSLEGKNNTILNQVEKLKIEWEKTQEELKAEQKKVSDLGQNILDAQTAKEQQKKTLLEKSTQINSLEGKNNTILNQVEKLKIELENTQEELKTEKNKAVDLEQDILDKQRAKDKQKNTLQEQSTQIVSLEGQCNTLSDEVSNKKVEIVTLTNELQTKQDELKAEQKKVSDLEQKILDAQTTKEMNENLITTRLDCRKDIIKLALDFILAALLMGLSIYSFLDFKYLGLSLFTHLDKACPLLIGGILGAGFIAYDLYKIFDRSRALDSIKNLKILMLKLLFSVLVAVSIMATGGAAALTGVSIASGTYASSSILEMGIKQCFANKGQITGHY